jgi:hypothetical protein
MLAAICVPEGERKGATYSGVAMLRAVRYLPTLLVVMAFHTETAEPKKSKRRNP